MRKNFYISRHGQTDYNLEERCQGCSVDAPLNETGIRQAHELAKILTDKKIEVIFCSNLQRAQKTAKIVADKLGVTVDIVEDLQEGNYGRAEGMLKTEMAAKFADIFAKWYQFPVEWDVAFPQGETRREMGERMKKVLNELVREDNQVIGIVSHGGIISSFLQQQFGESQKEITNCSWVHLVYEDGKWFLE